MIRFELPSLGADMDAGTLLEWKVRPGDAVARGQIVAVVDTSKAAVDLEIWQAGVVDELLVAPGTKVPVGTVLATLREAGEAAVQTRSSGDVEAPQPAGQVVQPQPQAEPLSRAGPLPLVEPERSAAPSPRADARELLAAARHPVSPAARKRARELGVDADAIAGTGAGGAVTVDDVERAAAQGHVARAEAISPPPAASTSATVAPSVPPGAPPPSDAVAARAREMRRAIAAAMSRAKREIPHYYLSETIPMARALEWLQQANGQRPIAERMLPAVLQLKAVALALHRVPELNGFYRDGRFEPAAAVHAGVAIALRGGGLVAPAIHDVAAKPLEQLMTELSDLVRRARAGSLRSSEMSDPTITVTNLGDQGSETVFGVIYPPQVALVGFGRIAQRPWAQDGWVKALPVVSASLAADHRVSDGHRGALFLTELADWLQRPEELAGG